MPLTTLRVVNVHRAHLLLEHTSRSALQCFLAALQPMFLYSRTTLEARRLIRCAMDVDQLAGDLCLG